MVLYLGLTKEQIYSQAENIKMEKLDSSKTPTKPECSLHSSSPYEDQQNKMKVVINFTEWETTVKIERDENLREDESLNSDEDLQLNSVVGSTLFRDHQIKEEIVIGPTVLLKSENSGTHKESNTKIAEMVKKDNKENNSLSSNIIKSSLCDSKADKGRNYLKSVNTSFKSHDLRNKSIKSIYICDICEISYKTKILLVKHLKEHTQPIVKSNRFKTDVKKSKNLETNLSSNAAQKNNLKCNICLKSFTLISNLQRHVRQFHDKVLTFSCDQCPKQFRRKDYLVNHTRAVHLSKGVLAKYVKEYECACGKHFFNRSTYRYHKATVCNIYNSSGDINLTCDICHKTYPNQLRLKRHVDYYHKNQVKREKVLLYCDFCNKNFTAKTRLVGHINRNHMKVTLPYECEVCGKKIAYLCSLKKHMISHSGYHPFSCKTCNQPFLSKWGRQIHEKKCFVLHDTGANENTPHFERNSNNIFTCKACNGAEFSLLRSFVRHWNRYHRQLNKTSEVP